MYVLGDWGKKVKLATGYVIASGVQEKISYSLHS